MSEQLEPASMSKTKVVKVLPTISLDSTDMPEVKNYDVGEEYDAVIHCKMVSKHQGGDSYGLYGGSEDDKLKDVVRGRFQILSIKPLDSKNNSDKMRVIKKKSSEY